MPYSYPHFKYEVKIHLEGTIGPTDRVLDVGPGSGTYARMCQTITMDAVEIHVPYIRQFNLGVYYRKVHMGDIRTFDVQFYDYLILGDVLEHLTFLEARELLDRIADKRFLVAVPYLLPQGEYDGNRYEIHHQDDLTPEIMAERYPELRLLIGNAEYGYYVNYDPDEIN
jgi:hypothetical protein